MSKHFFESPCFKEAQLWDHFLIQILATGDIRRPRPSQLFYTLPEALSKVEREFATIAQGFNIILYNEEDRPQSKNDYKMDFKLYNVVFLPAHIPYSEIILSNANVLDGIRSSVEQRVAQIIIRKPAWKDRREAIVQRLCTQGCTYLQVMLNLGILERGYIPSTRKGITHFLCKEALQPKGAFETAVGASSQGGPASLLLNWVFHALRPLTVSELAVALTLTPSKGLAGKLALEIISDELSSTVVRDLVNSMGTIIKLVNDEVMLVHRTIRGYFEAQRTLLGPHFHELATGHCLMYLSACAADMRTTSADAIASGQPCANPEAATAFLEYAETYWPEHYRLEPSPTRDLDEEVLRFLTSGTDIFKRWMSRFREKCQWDGDIDLDDTLQLAIQLGFRRVVRQIIKSKPATSSDRILDALKASARAGNTEIFLDLLGIAPPNSDLGPVLCAAAQYGHSGIVHLLVSQMDASSLPFVDISRARGDPLLLAASNGHTATIEVLLSHGYPLVRSQKPVEDGEPLSSRINVIHLAAQRGDAETLLALQRLRPAEFESLIESPNPDGKTPLQLCCIAGSPQAFDILFNISKPKGYQLRQLFSLAAESGHVAIVDKLLSVGASFVDGTVKSAAAPVELAAGNGHYAVVRRLIDEGEKLVDKTENLEANARAKLWKSQLHSSFIASVNNTDSHDSRIVALLAPHRDTSGAVDESVMLNAVYLGQLDTVKVLMDAGLSIHLNQGGFGYNLLLDAAIAGFHPDIIHFLVDQGIPVQWDPNNEETSIHYAARFGQHLCLRELLRKATYEDVLRKNRDNQTAFELAVEGGYTDAVKVFLDWKDGAALFEQSQGFQRPTKILLTALKTYSPHLVRLLLDSGWTADAADSRSQVPPLHAAIAVGEIHIIELLLERGANPNIRNNKHETALHVAIKWKWESAIRILLKYKADSKLRDAENLTPLHVAVKEDRSDLVAALLGFDEDQFDEEYQARTEKAAEESVLGNREVQSSSQSLAPASPQPGVDAEVSGSGLTPLLMAIENVNLKLVRMLLRAGADPNRQGGAFGSPLNTAIRKGEPAIIKSILSGGAHAQTITRPLGGPLHAFVFSSRFTFWNSSQIREVAKLLLAGGAEIDAGDFGGATPLTRAIVQDRTDFAEILLELGANASKQDSLGMTPLHYAAVSDSGKMIGKLMEAGVNPVERFHAVLEVIPAQDRKSHLESSLTAVLKSGTTKLFQEIIQVEGLDLNVPDRNGWTGLDIASYSKTLTEESDVLRNKGALNGRAMREPTGLCPYDRDYDITVSKDGREAWMEGTTNRLDPHIVGAVRADYCIPADKPIYFEVEILELEPQNVIAIGLLQERSTLLEHAGWQPGTWGYHSDDGSLITENETVAEDAPPYGPGQTVGVVVDLTKMKACFSLDNVWRSPPIDISGQLYPAVSFLSQNVRRSQVRINFGIEGGTEFKYKPSDDWADSIASQVPFESLETQPEEGTGEP
ncbi:hypothetical protein DL768_004668 [Monosporascus sp. mg162]|nr:hypothetical protein DL768_004668 [Monosporascus sp. mg162]